MVEDLNIPILPGAFIGCNTEMSQDVCLAQWRMRTEGDQEIKPLHGSFEMPGNQLEEQRYRHCARRIGYERQNFFAF